MGSARRLIIKSLFLSLYLIHIRRECKLKLHKYPIPQETFSMLFCIHVNSLFSLLFLGYNHLHFFGCSNYAQLGQREPIWAGFKVLKLYPTIFWRLPCFPVPTCSRLSLYFLCLYPTIAAKSPASSRCTGGFRSWELESGVFAAIRVSLSVAGLEI